MLSYIVPDLRLAEDDQFGGLFAIAQKFILVLDSPVYILAPDIEESAEHKAFHSEKVVHAPHKGELQGDVLGLSGDAFVHQFKSEGVAEVSVVQEIFQAEQPRVVDEIAFSQTTVPFNVQAQGSDATVLPEVQRPGNLGVAVRRTGFVELVVDVGEEESATPIVGLEHLKGRG